MVGLEVEAAGEVVWGVGLVAATVGAGGEGWEG